MRAACDDALMIGKSECKFRIVDEVGRVGLLTTRTHASILQLVGGEALNWRLSFATNLRR